MRTIPDTELLVTDKYGEPQTIRRTQNGYQVKRERLSPIIALNREIGLLAGQRIKELRLAKGWTLETLGVRADIRPPTKQRMWEIENGIREGMTLGTIYSVAMALGVDVMAILPPASELHSIAKPQVVRRTMVKVQS